MSIPRALAPLLLAGSLLFGCATPPPEAYVSSTTTSTGTPAGTDAKGEACLIQPGAAPPADLPIAQSREVFCGGWGQAAARVVSLRGPNDAARLDALANGGLWRTWLDQRVNCQAPQATALAGGTQARLLTCTRRQGGWPHIALVAAGADGPVLADGVAAAAPVMERLATGQAVGTASAGAQARSSSLELAVQRLSSEAFGANDVGRYDQLMRLGRDLNQAENYAAAEDAFRAALALQERVLGRDNPDSVTAMMMLAINLSNQGRTQEAEALLTRASTLAPRASDPLAPAMQEHYRGLINLAKGDFEAEVVSLRNAERLYAALVPVELLSGRGDVELGGTGSPAVRNAVLGLADVRRYIARALARDGQSAEAEAMFASSRSLLVRTQLQNGAGTLVGRSFRSQARYTAQAGRGEAAAALLESAARRFAIAAPGERPEAVTLFLTGNRRNTGGSRAAALEAFRAGAAILRARQLALSVPYVLPYIDALVAEANANPAQAAALRKEAFAAAQLAQRSNTVRFVQQASARLGAAGGDARVGEAVRRLQDADQALRTLFTERDTGAVAPDLDARIAAAQQARADAETEVAAAAPGYRQLLLASVDADAVGAALSPDEVLVAILLGGDHGYSIAVRRGEVNIARIDLGEQRISGLVTQLRAGAVNQQGQPGQFDPVAAQGLYDALLAPLAATLEGAETLIVAPDGPLLAVPFGMLLTGPADASNLGGAPWLIRKFAIVHIPSPQTLVTLRAAGLGSNAPLPYAGFGDFVPPTPAQLVRSFPVDRCAADARLAAGLVRLPGTRVEVQIAQQLTHAGPQEVRLGADFTAASLVNDQLGRHRIIHLATHALLPGELSCLTEPSIVVSPARGALDANSAFVKASDLLGLKLDADLIVLSACNTGGPGGAGGGEALSGLARAFFYTGARGLLVTHWAVDDAAAALTVSDAIRRQQAGASSAASLRGAQLLILDEAGKRLPVAFAHPFYWAPFALIGDGRRAAARSAANAPAPAAL